jgi:hypothetical protein
MIILFKELEQIFGILDLEKKDKKQLFVANKIYHDFYFLKLLYS